MAFRPQDILGDPGEGMIEKDCIERARNRCKINESNEVNFSSLLHVYKIQTIPDFNFAKYCQTIADDTACGAVLSGFLRDGNCGR